MTLATGNTMYVYILKEHWDSQIVGVFDSVAGASAFINEPIEKLIIPAGKHKVGNRVVMREWKTKNGGHYYITAWEVNP